MESKYVCLQSTRKTQDERWQHHPWIPSWPLRLLPQLARSILPGMLTSPPGRSACSWTTATTTIVMDVGPDPPSGAACGGQGEEGGHPHFTGGETHRAVGQGQGWNRDRQAESREEAMQLVS